MRTTEVTAHIIDGKAFAAGLREQIACEVSKFQEQFGRTPGLAVILVGDDPASRVYVGAKGRATQEAGMGGFEFSFSKDVGQSEVVTLIKELNNDERVDGILVQLPLPPHIDTSLVLDTISPEKDVDGFHMLNAGRLACGLPSLVPCTPLGCLMLLEHTLGSLAGLHAVVVGRSNIVGKPMAQLLLQRDCTVTIAHSRSRDLPAVVRSGDIVVAAVGRAGLIRGDWLKPGATVIDVGINRTSTDADGRSRLVGDVAFDEACEVASSITPVPGGVGPMTIAVLLKNTLTAAIARQSLSLEKVQVDP